MMPEANLSECYESFKRSLLGIAARNNPEKNAAPLETVLTALFLDWEVEEEQGSVCVRWPANETTRAAAAVLEEFGLAVNGAKLQIEDAPRYGLDPAPFVIEEERDGMLRLYPQASFFEEALLGKYLARLAGGNTAPGEGARAAFAAIPAQKPLSAVIEERDAALLSAHPMQEVGCNARQLEAIAKSMEKQLTVICGGPGTGKTTSGTYIISCFLADHPDAVVYLTAPTGKAASRLRDAILENYAFTKADSVKEAVERHRIKTGTIHKWLVTETSQGKRPSPRTPLECDLLLIDEASMIDSSLAFRLFSVIDPKRTKVVVLGDKDQLAAVGPGAVYADISNPKGALKDNLVELTEARRFNYTIQQLARAINREKGAAEAKESYACAKLEAVLEKFQKGFEPNPLLSAEENAKSAEDAPVIRFDAAEVPSGEKLSKPAVRWLEAHLKGYVKAIEDNLVPLASKAVTSEEKSATLEAVWDVLSRFRALAAQREGPMSVNAINAFAEHFVKKRIGAAEDDKLYNGKVIIVRKNDAAFDISNGDVGIIYRAEDGSWQSYFGDLRASKPAQLLPAYDTAYAITIHQSQGSGFSEVAVFLPFTDGADDRLSVGLATQELLYTAVTRAKTKCVVFGSPQTLRMALSSRTVRSGGLAFKLEKFVKSA